MSPLTEKKIIQSKYWDIAALACLLACISFFVWKAPYGFGFDDESWYLTFSQRLTFGDSLLTDEWHLAQMIGFILYLPTKAYISIVGSTEGIIMFFRYLFIALQSFVYSIIYLRLRKYGWPSIVAGMFYFLHIPFTIMALGYYSMGIAFVVLTGVLIATAQIKEKPVFFFAGVFFSFAVLCIPILAAVYLLFSILMLFYEVKKRKGTTLFNFSEETFSLKAWIPVTAGIATVLLIFIIFLFSRTTFKEITENFPMLFTDPEYRVSATDYGLANIFTPIKSLKEIFDVSPYMFVITAMFFAIIALDKKRIAHKRLYLVLSTISFIAYSASVLAYVNWPYLGYWMYPFALLGLACYIFLGNRNKKLFYFIWVFGLVYAVCLDTNSLMQSVVSSQAFALCDIASILFVADILRELKKEKEFTGDKKYISLSVTQRHKNASGKTNRLESNIIPILMATAIVLQIFSEIFFLADFKYNIEYLVFDSSAAYGASMKRDLGNNLDTMIKIGPKKGIKTTAYFADLYNGALNDLSEIKENEKVPVLVIATMPWCYLYLEMPYATHTTWCEAYNFGSEMARLKNYYRLHPEKKPVYIYLPKFMEPIYVPNPQRVQNIMGILKKNLHFSVYKESNYGYILKISS